MAVIDSIPELTYNEAGLIPCIVQDAKTREVLMMAWMNEESVRLTLEQRTTWFFGTRAARPATRKRSSSCATTATPTACSHWWSPQAPPATRATPPASTA